MLWWPHCWFKLIYWQRTVERVARARVLFCQLSYADGGPWAGDQWGLERMVSYPLTENGCSFLVKLIYCYESLPLFSFIQKDRHSGIHLLDDPTDIFIKIILCFSAGA